MAFPFSPSLVIFDCDGVLVDSEPVANRLLARVLAEDGFDV
ncbi:MAG TPA: HAD family hydrolase, partial [Parvibaculum sp.]|nr:HAD family hydrolase [Parvibaculum sp.]